ncbi:avidin/streptavidin family protein, partial [Acinetobacter baumannii]
MHRDLRGLKPHAGAAIGLPIISILGVWQNELGSTMAINTMQDAEFFGTYTSTVSGGGGSVSGPLVGA